MLLRKCWSCFFVGLTLVACSTQTPGDPASLGSIRVPLLATGSNGTQYHLGGTFDIQGPSPQTIDAAGDQSSVTLDLQVGDYSIELLQGWQLARVEADLLFPVQATLQSVNPQSFAIQADTTTNVAFLFQTQGVDVTFGNGTLVVTTEVNEAHESNCSDSADDDSDGLIDCADLDCANDAACAPCASECNGECVDLSTDVENCGTCGNACNAANTVGGSCSQGTCQYSACSPGFGDCAQVSNDGCETALDDVTNCGGCGNSCQATNAAMPGCDGTSCSYTCNAGFMDCNAASGANLDGCECAGTGCCAGACQTTHSNGLGQSYFDCSPLGTYSLTAAQAARAAWTGAGVDAQGACGSGGPSSPQCVSRQTATQCAVWCYTKSVAGHVNLSNTTSCTCPTTASPTWN